MYTSKNFKFLEKERPDLYKEACFIEKNLLEDMQSSGIHARTLIGNLLDEIYEKESFEVSEDYLDEEGEESILGKTKDLFFDKKFITKRVNDNFHNVRIQANKAAHRDGTRGRMLFLNENLFNLLIWFYKHYYDRTLKKPEYIEPDLVDLIEPEPKLSENIKKEGNKFILHNDNKTFGEFDSLEDAEFVENRLKENRWNINYFKSHRIINNNGTFYVFIFNEQEKLNIKKFSNKEDAKNEII